MASMTQFDDLYEYYMFGKNQIEESNEYTRSLISSMFQQFLLLNRLTQYTPVVHSSKYSNIPSYTNDPFVSQR